MEFSVSWTLLLSSLSASATLIGAVIVIARGQHRPLTSSHLAFTCGLATAVMGFVSLAEMIYPATKEIGVNNSLMIATIATIITGALIKLAPIDSIIECCGLDEMKNLPLPDSDMTEFNVADPIDDEIILLVHRPHSPVRARSMLSVKSTPTSPKLPPPARSANSSAVSANIRTLRLGLISAIIQAIHNIPEALSVVLSASSSDAGSNGLLMAVAIGAHNAVEGILVAVPIYSSTRSVKFTFWMTGLSGISELFSSFIALALLRDSLTVSIVHRVLSGVAGVMLAVILIELLPVGFAYQRLKYLLQGFFTGIVFMILMDFAVNKFDRQ